MTTHNLELMFESALDERSVKGDTSLVGHFEFGVQGRVEMLEASVHVGAQASVLIPNFLQDLDGQAVGSTTQR